MKVESGDEGVGERLEWALGTYTVPRFANLIGEFVMGFEEQRDAVVMGLGKKVKGKVEVFRKEVLERRRGGERAGLLFGEIEKFEDEEVEKKESFAKGLLWYYGRSGVAPLETVVARQKKVSLLERIFRVKTD